MLELRPSCELCDVDLPPQAPNARICTYECTFCDHCVDEVLMNVCPNCGGGFERRPVRPSHQWRPGTGLVNHPASTVRVRAEQPADALAELTRRLAGVPPAER